MRTLTASEKRTIRLAAIVLAVGLALSGGIKVWKFFGKRRADYSQKVAEARLLKSEARGYADKAAAVKKLMDDFHLDPAKLAKNSVVAGASAAIQKAATSGGLQPGPIRESPGRPANKELATIQFEGTGQVASVMSLLHRLPLLGYPLVIDAMQITRMRRGPARSS